MVVYIRLDMYRWILWPWMILSEVLEMIPIYKQLQIIPIQIIDQVRVETNYFLDMIGSNP